MTRFVRRLARAGLTPKIPLTAWWGWRTMGFKRPVRIAGWSHFGPRSAKLEWVETGELLQAMSIFGPDNPWNSWQPAESITTIVDVGANIGQTVAYWALRFPTARLGAVEMMRENAVRVDHHGRLNNWKLSVLQVAATNKTGSVKVRRSVANSRHRLEEIVEASAVRDNLTEEMDVVPALPVGTILDRLGFWRVDLMKVDVEGAEVLLLGDLRNWAPRVLYLIIEIHDNVDPDWAKGALEKAGYEVRSLESGSRTEWLCRHTSRQ